MIRFFNVGNYRNKDYDYNACIVNHVYHDKSIDCVRHALNKVTVYQNVVSKHCYYNLLYDLLINIF